MGSSQPLGFYARIQRYLNEDIWRVDDQTCSWRQRCWVQFVRFCWSVRKGFQIHANMLHASALSYYTLLTIVPLLALGLSLARVFGGEEIARRAIDRQIVEWVGNGDSASASVETPKAHHAVQGHVAPVHHEQPLDANDDFAQRVVTLIHTVFNQADRLGLRTLGGIGLIGLLWMTIGMLARVEASMNTIWGVTQGRPFWRSCTDYLSVVLIVPTLVLAASTVPVMDLIARHASAVAGVSAGSIKTVVGSLFVKKAIILLFATLACSFLLSFMPNTHVRPGPTLAGGFFTAVLFTGWLRLCALMQIGVAKYSLLYGSLAMLPILMAWVYISWAIVLVGAEVTCILQYGTICPTAGRRRLASPRTRLALLLTLSAEAARTLREQGIPFDSEAFIAARHLPARLSRNMLKELVSAGLFAEVSGRSGFYLPCRDLDSFTVADLAKYVLDDGLSAEEVGLHRLDGNIMALTAAMERPFEDLPVHSGDFKNKRTGTPH